MPANNQARLPQGQAPWQPFAGTCRDPATCSPTDPAAACRPDRYNAAA